MFIAIRRHRTERQSIPSAIVIVLMTLVLFGCRGQSTQPEPDEGKAVADKFLDQIRTGHAEAAWESTTAEFKSAEGREAFVRRVKQHPWLLKQLAFESILPVTIQNSVRSEYVYRAAAGQGKVRLLAGNERGAWRIDRMVAE